MYGGGGYGGGYPQQGGGFPQQGGYQQQQQGGYGYPQSGYQQQGGYQQQYQVPSGPTLKDWFDSVDTDQSGRIDAGELIQTFKKAGFDMSMKGAQRILHLFDKNNSGTITFQEFEPLHKFTGSMVNGFRKRDASGDGFLEQDEIQAALSDGGLNVQPSTLALFMQKFDSSPGHSGAKLGFEDYVTLSCFISNVRNTFNYYDKQRSGHVTFDINSFMTASVALRRQSEM